MDTGLLEVVETSHKDKPIKAPEMVAEALRELIPHMQTRLELDTFDGEEVITSQCLPTPAEGGLCGFVIQIVMGVKMLSITPEEEKKLSAALDSAIMDSKATVAGTEAKN